MMMTDDPASTSPQTSVKENTIYIEARTNSNCSLHSISQPAQKQTSEKTVIAVDPIPMAENTNGEKHALSGHFCRMSNVSLAHVLHSIWTVENVCKWIKPPSPFPRSCSFSLKMYSY